MVETLGFVGRDFFSIADTPAPDSREATGPNLDIPYYLSLFDEKRRKKGKKNFFASS
jgi:hypothetical protein